MTDLQQTIAPLDYCETHTALNDQYGRDFGPFLGCPDCPKPDGFDPRTQFHLYGPREAAPPPAAPPVRSAVAPVIARTEAGVCGAPGCGEPAVLYPCGWRCRGHQPSGQGLPQSAEAS